MENPINMGWFGGPTPIFGNTQILFFGNVTKNAKFQQLLKMLSDMTELWI